MQPMQQPMQPQMPVRGAQPSIESLMREPTFVVPAVGGIVLAVSTLLPWISGTGVDSFNAFEADLPWVLTGLTDTAEGSVPHGILFIIAALAGVALAWMNSSGSLASPMPLLAVGGASTVVAVADLFRFQDFLGDFEGVSTGVGLFAAILGSLGIAGGGALAMQQQQQPMQQQAMQQQAMQQQGMQQQPMQQQFEQPVQQQPMQQQQPVQQQQPAQQQPPAESQWWN